MLGGTVFRRAARAGSVLRPIAASQSKTGGGGSFFRPLIALAAVGVGVASSCGGSSGSDSCSASNPFVVDPRLCNPATADSVYAFRARDIDGNMVELGGDRYRGHVLVVVNVASE